MLPSAEICNQLDDDCDGSIDEECSCQSGQTQPCYSGSATTNGVGRCTPGTQECVSGAWSEDCVGELLPKSESCNGQDDDCDGKTDEGACCSSKCASHDACGSDGCGKSCGTCSGDRTCQSGKCVWDHGNNGSETCSTICAWGKSQCVGTSAYDCGTKGQKITCYCW